MRKLSILLIVLALLILMAFPAAASFTAEMPDYVSISGGAWFEVYDSVLGRCTVVIPVEFKNNCLAFVLSDTGIPLGITNVTNTTIYGAVVTSSGEYYDVRASRFDTFYFQNVDSSYSQWEYFSMDVTAISNTNIMFLTDNPLYYNDTVIDYDKYNLAMTSIIAIVLIINLFVSLLRKGRRVY